MSKFITPLDAPLRDDSDEIYVLRSRLVYMSDIAGMIIVPAGFQTDLASVPRLPFTYAFFGGRAHREAVLHDYLYRTDSNPNVSFMDANRVFFEAMATRGKPAYISYPMFWGVCAGGLPSYHKREVRAVL